MLKIVSRNKIVDFCHFALLKAATTQTLVELRNSVYFFIYKHTYITTMYLLDNIDRINKF
jgi:hypothetical protein